MIIFRYLAKQILASVFATSLVLLLIFVANQFIHYLNDAASGKITVHAVMLVTLIQLPMLLGYILPLGLFLAILLTLGRLYVDYEMVVLASCGVSRSQIVQMVLAVALLVTAVDIWLMLSVEPSLFRYRTEVVRQSLQSATLDKLLPRRFQALGDAQHTIYLGKMNKAKRRFEDVFVAKQNTPDDKSTLSSWQLLTAKSVEQHQTQHGVYFDFNQGYRYSGTAGTSDYRVLQFDKYSLRLPMPAISVRGRYSAMPTSELIARYAYDNNAMGELQWRVVIALSTLVLALLAIPLAKVNPRKGRFGQLLPAILLYVAYANMMFVSKSWLQHGQMPTWLGLWWILVVMLLVAFSLLLYQQGSWRRWWRGRQ